MRRIADGITGRVSAWIVLALTIAAGAAILVLGSGSSGETLPSVGLPESAESVRAAALADELPGSDGTAAIFVYTRSVDSEPGPVLDDDDLAAIAESAAALMDFADGGFVPPPVVSDDSTAAIVTVPLTELTEAAEQSERAEALRETAREGLPEGLSALLTGPEGFAVDIAGVFAGANFTLLLVTVIVVAVLLIITYRSPLLWLMPLAIVGLADAVAGIAADRVLTMVGLQADASIKGILSVLVFGAGTNYALLLIARYRDELRVVADRRAAMATALRSAAPAIIASGGTVTLSLLVLLTAQLEGNRALGLACAVGVVIAMLFALTALPALLVAFGRWLFWPAIPRVGDTATAERGLWRSLGERVSRRPAVVASIGAVVLGALAFGGVGVQVGLAQTEQFTKVPEAVVGQQAITAAFPGGTASPAFVMTGPDHVDAVLAAAADVDGVASVRPGEAEGDIARVDVVLEDSAETPGAFQAVLELRAAMQAIDGADAVVGGIDSQSLDVAQTQQGDQDRAIPLILAIVFIVLVLLLRALVAPLLLLLTVVASFFASLGAGWLLFQHVLGFPAIDTSVSLFSFLFLVALGVDYNIFLVTRAREEAVEHGTREGMIRALASTGGVITSAGILLAAVFAVLGVLPLITLTQIGIIVCIGVLLDTLLVRTLIVPSLAMLTGERFWWPGRALSVGAEVRLGR
jgi:RND superfamily putative drug exporter